MGFLLSFLYLGQQLQVHVFEGVQKSAKLYSQHKGHFLSTDSHEGPGHGQARTKDAVETSSGSAGHMIHGQNSLQEDMGIGDHIGSFQCLRGCA